MGYRSEEDSDYVGNTESGLKSSQHVDRTGLLLGHLMICIWHKHNTCKEREEKGLGWGGGAEQGKLNVFCHLVHISHSCLEQNQCIV
jgi:hypothetical protein